MGDSNLRFPLDAKTVVFSFVGMKSQEFLIAGKTTFSVVMAEEAVAMDDVVGRRLWHSEKRECGWRNHSSQ